MSKPDNSVLERHTPGPWKAGDTAIRNSAYWLLVRSEASGSTVGGAVSGNGRADANARLIAAAPELLDALKALVRACEFNGYFSTNKPGFREKSEIRDSRAAIAKAEGAT